MKTAAVFIYTLLFILILSCSTTGENSSSASDASNTVLPDADRITELTREYSDMTLYKSLVQFHEILNSYDYFNQFTWGDYIFEDYLTIIYGLDNSFFNPGNGSEISVYDKDGNIKEVIRRSVIETNGKGEIYWQTEHSRDGDDTVFYEVLTNRFSVPVTVRFRNIETKEAFSRDTMFGESVRDAMLNMSDKEIQAKLDEERSEDVSHKLLHIYNGLNNLGVEIIEAGGKKIEAVHYQGVVPDSDGTGNLDVWYSPDVPQGIIRININKSTIAEISGWIRGAERKITEDSPHELPAYSTSSNDVSPDSELLYSEGSVSDPVKLNMEEIWEGSVEPEGISYYSFVVPYDGDISCTVSGFTGLAELYYFENDQSYTDWITGSEGGELDFQSYAAKKGDIVFFSVNDISDSYSDGEKYYIDIQMNALLDTLGVRMMGNYMNDPEILDKGKNRIKVSGSEIIYFKYEIEEKGSVELHVENIEYDNEKFSFIDVAGGSYSSSSFVDNADSRIISITGLEQGSSLYFYMVRKEDLKNKKITITVK